MTNQQALDEYAKLAEIVGWPEWDSDERECCCNGPQPIRRRLRVLGGEARKETRHGAQWISNEFCDTYEALCLWQNHARRWLKCSRDSVRIHQNDAQTYANVWLTETKWECFVKPTYDEALIAAAKWVGEQKGDGGE